MNDAGADPRAQAVGAEDGMSDGGGCLRFAALGLTVLGIVGLVAVCAANTLWLVL